MNDHSAPLPGDASSQAARAQFFRLVVAGTGAWMVAYLSYYAQTLMMSALMAKFDQREAAVGLLSSLENGAFFAVMMLAAGPAKADPNALRALPHAPMHRRGRRWG